MIAIKDFEMPRCCIGCPILRDSYGQEAYCPFVCEENNINIKQRTDRPSECPLVDIEPVKTGHWIDLNENNDGHCDDFGQSYVKCSECDQHNGTDRSEYCPGCGARMWE